MPATWVTCSRCQGLFEVPEGLQPPPTYCPTCAAPADLSAGPEEVQWFCAIDRKKIGPIPWQQLRQLCLQGQLKPEDMVLQAGTQKWQMASAVHGLIPPKPANIDERA